MALLVPMLTLSLTMTAAEKNPLALRLSKGRLPARDAWYGSPESMIVAENVLLMQKDNGGWEKNYRKYRQKLSPEDSLAAVQGRAAITESTIDNKATYTELVFLANQYQVQPDERYRQAFRRGLEFLLSIQYDNGGFKQFSRDKGYYTHITYNDGAMVNVMTLFWHILQDDEIFRPLVDKALRARIADAFDRGIDCILKTQYVQNGVKTVWCAQHDEVTLQPANARAYELASLSGAESAGIVRLLMALDHPSTEVQQAVHAAMAWFEANRISDHRIATVTDQDGRPNRVWIESNEGPDLWGRFCDLKTNRPFCCDRDGIVKYDISEIGYERRNGYGWYSEEPGELFPLYELWCERWGQKN